MRKVTPPEDADLNDYDFEHLDIHVIDWKQGSMEMLEAFDDLLKYVEMELVVFETGGDAFVFGMDQRRED
jgi:hypothetical protein